MGAYEIDLKAPSYSGPPTKQPPIPVNVWVNGGEIKTVHNFDMIKEIPMGDFAPGTYKLIFHGWVEYVAVVESDPEFPPRKIHSTTFFYQFDFLNKVLRYRPEYTTYT